ncbi:hypothetical protein F8R89_00195 [Streptomyces sp. SS1-1]|uniref:hypothetical protein n=1 Tax=Streptomyces sp. SS1-1 TaxID=2651869 RepID=UPI001250040B|nr:hypothetical protein [Streptomyces sp. SS1-1]KAB2977529.1 hypothetical protein F8R89_00195 [Streptomyces sp. SS1-1]
MSAPSSAANSIETATALLQSELSRFEEQRKDLQNQLQLVQTNLAVVSGNIESIRGALAALSAVPSVESAAPETGAERPHVVPAPEPEDTEAAPESTGREVEFEAASPAESAPRGSRFTEQVIAVLARNPSVALRARDVAEALGRDENAGSINAVRSTLDRLVATSRARRAGKGLYQAPAD